MLKIVADIQPRTYEVTYLIPEGFTDAERQRLDAEISQMIQTKHQGKIEKTEDWGSRRLAYKIKRHGKNHAQASYTHLVVTMNPDQAQPLNRALELHPTLVRHLVVIASPVVEVQSVDTAE